MGIWATLAAAGWMASSVVAAQPAGTVTDGPILQEVEFGAHRPEGPSVSLENAPPALGTDEVTARVILACDRLEGFAVQGCRIGAAEPAGHGFEALSLKIAPWLRVRTARDPSQVHAGPLSLRLTYRNVTDAPANAHLAVAPDWAQTPSADALGRAYPQAARGRSGTVQIKCQLNAEGRLVDCAVATESPTGAGFGEAALKLADQFRAWPQLLDGQPIGGATIQIPLIFKR